MPIPPLESLGWKGIFDNLIALKKENRGESEFKQLFDEVYFYAQFSKLKFRINTSSRLNEEKKK